MTEPTQRNAQIALCVALAVLAVVTTIMIMRLEAADRANNRQRPRVKTDVPKYVRDIDAGPDSQAGGD